MLENGDKNFLSEADFLLTASECWGLLRISKASFYAKVRKGRLPQPVKLGERSSRWRKADILRVMTEGAMNG